MTLAVHMASDDFYHAYTGRCKNLLRWDDLAALWAQVQADAGGGWYLYVVGEPPPIQPAADHEVQCFIAEVDALLHREHREDYCGIVYVDDPQVPSLIKVFHPNRLGVVCGSSDRHNPTLPAWIMSKRPPVAIDRPPARPKRRWWWPWKVARS